MPEAIKIITTNRRARYEYHIEQTMEAGLVLQGTEVKALRDGKANLQDAYATVRDGQALLVNCHISPYRHGTRFNHDPLRPRVLLLHRKEIDRLDRAIQQKGYTIIPLKLYFKKGLAKIELGIAKGKKLYDKRATITERDVKRQLDRVMKNRS